MRRTVGLTALEQQHKRRRGGAGNLDHNPARHRGHRQVADRMAIRGQFGKTLERVLVAGDVAHAHTARHPVKAAGVENAVLEANDMRADRCRGGGTGTGGIAGQRIGTDQLAVGKLVNPREPPCLDPRARPSTVLPARQRVGADAGITNHGGQIRLHHRSRHIRIPPPRVPVPCRRTCGSCRRRECERSRDDMVQQALIVGDDKHRPAGITQNVHPFGHDPQRIDIKAGIGLVENRHRRLEQGHLQDLVAFLLTAGKADIHGALQHLVADPQQPCLLANDFHEGKLVDFLFAGLDPAGIDRRPQEAHPANARKLDRILEGQEHAGTGPLVGLHLQHRLAVHQDVAAGHLITVAACQHIGHGAFAGTVRPHDGMHLAGIDGQVDPLQDRRVADRGMKITNFKQSCHCLSVSFDGRRQPTDPSRLIPMSFCASTANSIGSSFITSLQKPFTISDTASSSAIPRCRQ